VAIAFGQRRAERRDAGAHHVHRMRGRRQRLEHVAQSSRQLAASAESRPKRVELSRRRQLAA